MAYTQDRRYDRKDYIDGNTVRLILPERTPEPEKKVEKKPVRKPLKKANRISPAFAAFSAAAGVVIMAAAINCICMQTSVTTKLDNIAKLEKQLLELRESNSQLETKISSLTDINYIYETATLRLGMVPASDDSIIYFDKTESEYVRQNEFIPKE